MGGNVLFIDTKDYIMTMMKLRSLQFFREIITNHVQSGTELYRCLLLHDPISDEIVSDIDVASPLATVLSAILIQFNVTLIILLDNIFMDIISLILQEVSGLDHLCKDIAYSNKLVLI